MLPGAMRLPCQRSLFDLPEDITWLNCAYMSPQLLGVSEAGVRAVVRKGRPWHVRPEDFFTESETLRGRFAALVEGDAEGVALVPSVSYGLAAAAANVVNRTDTPQKTLRGLNKPKCKQCGNVARSRYFASCFGFPFAILVR